MVTSLAPRTGLIGVPSSNGLALPPDLTFEEWRAALNTADLLVSAGPWFLCDIMAYGEQRFPDQHSQALPTAEEDPDGSRQARMKQAAWMATKFPSYARNPKLSYTHHRAVAELEPMDRQALLTEAATLNLSTRDLISRVKARQESIAATVADASSCAADAEWVPAVEDLADDARSALEFARASARDRSFSAGAIWALRWAGVVDAFAPGRYQDTDDDDPTAIFGPTEEG